MAANKKAARKSGGRKYGKAAGKTVASAMRRKKKGTLKSGKGGKLCRRGVGLITLYGISSSSSSSSTSIPSSSSYAYLSRENSDAGMWDRETGCFWDAAVEGLRS